MCNVRYATILHHINEAHSFHHSFPLPSLHPSSHKHTVQQTDNEAVSMLHKCVIINTNCTAQTANCHIILYKHSYFFFSQFKVLNKAKERKFYVETRGRKQKQYLRVFIPDSPYRGCTNDCTLTY